jgi:hypothetical protein
MNGEAGSDSIGASPGLSRRCSDGIAARRCHPQPKDGGCTAISQARGCPPEAG